MDKKDIVVMLDSSHGCDVVGKCSPDKSIREYKYVREIVEEVKARLEKNGVEVFLTCPEIKECGLTNRTVRANTKYRELKKVGRTAIFVSVHVNASGNGKWMTASGWSVFTSKGQTKGDVLARYFYDAACETLKPMAQRVRADFSDGDPDYEENFTVLVKTSMPAVLTENMFMDNMKDVKFLLSPEGKEAIIELHYNAIMNYIDGE